MRTLLIDADILVYKVTARNQAEYDFGDTGKAVHLGDINLAKREADEKIRKFMVDLNGDHAIVCFSCATADGFRKDFFPEYKTNRIQEKPHQLPEVRKYLTEKYHSWEQPRLEADDIMGILSTHPLLVGGEKVIVSEDKDMKTIPGLLHNPDWKNKTIYKVHKDEATYNHMYQTLCGDPTDGYKGCPDIGKVKAAKALAGIDPKDMWAVVQDLYNSKGLTGADALVQARCARILQHEDYNFERSEVYLWSPI